MFDYQRELKLKMNTLVHEVYRLTKNFPKNEIYGLVSQLNRASLSIILNYVEGYARISKGNRLNFLEISYGSLKETQYLLHFICIEKFINSKDYKTMSKLADEIGAMLWTEINNLSKK
ncbi:MAG: four helix bundle protein [Candidatus Magasanikiibacteriota bacterium]